MLVRVVRKERGATFVEFSLVALLFFFIIFAALQLMLMCYTWLSLQFVVSRVMRDSVIGPPPVEGEVEVDPAAQQAAHTSAMEAEVIDTAKGLLVHLEPANVHICQIADVNNINIRCNPDNAGEGGNLVTIFVEHPYRVPFLNTHLYTVDALALGRNEFY